MNGEIANMADVSATANIANGYIPDKQTVFLMCDIQERFRQALHYFNQMLEVSNKLVEASRILNIPLIVTEQYPDGLGKTVQELDISHAYNVHKKTKFSMMIPDVRKDVGTLCEGSVKCAILFGLETHVCIEQTAMDLISMGIQVHVVADATFSRSQEDRLLAFERLRQIGCFITTTETVLFKLLGDKNHPKFYEIRPFLKTTSPSTGLVAKI